MLCQNTNPEVMSILETYLDKIEWITLSLNSCPWAISILEKHPDKIYWPSLSYNTNPSALHIFEKYPDKVDWVKLSGNPSIFTLDYDFLRKRMDVLREELMSRAWHPSRMMAWLEQGMEVEDL